MAFTQSSFGPISSHGNSDMPNIWTYRTPDNKATVNAVDYFAKKLPILNDGDFINVDASDGRYTANITITGGTVQSFEQISFNPTTDMLIERILEGVSVAVSQNPGGLGIANALSVEFGPAINGPSDPVELNAAGVATFNVSGLYRIKAVMQFGRTGSPGVSELLFRFLVNGVQLGRSVSAKLGNADELVYIDIDNWFNVPAGATLVVQVMRDNGGNDSGGLVQFTPTNEGAGTWNVTPSAVLRVERMVPA